MKPMKHVHYLLLASIITSASLHNPCFAKPTICKAYDYVKRAALLATPSILNALTRRYIIERYTDHDSHLRSIYANNIIHGAYAAYFWPKALHQKLK